MKSHARQVLDPFHEAGELVGEAGRLQRQSVGTGADERVPALPDSQHQSSPT